MSDKATAVNPLILKWAREASNKSLSDVASHFNKSEEEIAFWETGQTYPTYVQLESLAYKLYHRPIAIFFFPQPPSEVDVLSAYRTIPTHDLSNLSSNVLYLIRQAQAMQTNLEYLNAHEYFGTKPVTELHQIDITDTPSIVSIKIREMLGVELTKQISWRNTELALAEWRKSIQDHGVYVFKRPFKDDTISGFCVISDKYPVIYVNNSHSFSRQIFTLIHEFVHVLMGEYGISMRTYSYINRLQKRYKKIEEYCNKVAAEILIPKSDFNKFINNDFTSDAIYSRLSSRYSVSREVVLRKALDVNIIDAAFYREKVDKWYERVGVKDSRTGGSFYNNQKAYLGQKYIDLSFARYYQGSVTREQLSDYLLVKSKFIPKLDPLNKMTTVEDR